MTPLFLANNSLIVTDRLEIQFVLYRFKAKEPVSGRCLSKIYKIKIAWVSELLNDVPSEKVKIDFMEILFNNSLVSTHKREISFDAH